MSYISFRLLTSLDFQRQPCWLWILLRETLGSSSLSVDAMSWGMFLEIKELLNWSVSVGDVSFQKPADFFGGRSRKNWMLHELKRLSVIHSSYSLKFKLNCQHFPLLLLFSVNKAMWFVLSLQHLLYSFLCIQGWLLSSAVDRILPLRYSHLEYCGGFAIATCHW